MTTTWPDGVIARYLTVANATVDVTNQNTSRCTGCGETDHHDRLVKLTNSESRARAWAQSHAETCRAMPKPINDLT